MTNFLLERPWLAPVALAFLVAVGPPVGRWLVVRPRTAWVLLGLSLVPIAATTMWPIDRELYAFCVVQWSLPTPARVELMANVVLFVTPALLLTVATRRPAAGLLGGAGLSVGIELLQAIAPGIGRSCDTTDWLSNSIGAALGAALGYLALRLHQRKVESSPEWG